jgi:hypothetical protein
MTYVSLCFQKSGGTNRVPMGHGHGLIGDSVALSFAANLRSSLDERTYAFRTTVRRQIAVSASIGSGRGAL